MLSQATILELQEIIKEDYGREVTFEEASSIARGAIGWYDALAKIYHKMKTEDEYEKRSEKI